MDQNLREHYQWLQVLVYSLQLPEWPLEKEIKRDYAFGLVVNFAPSLGIALDPKDPSFLSTVAQKIDQILAEQEEVTAIPENLKELVRDYEEYLETTRDRSLKATFPSLDEQIKALYEKYQQSIQEELVELEKEITPDLKIIKEPNQRLFEEISHRMASEFIKALPQTAREKGPSALGEKEYQKILNTFQPLFTQELGRAGFSKPKIETSKAFVGKIAAKTLPEARALSFVPHKSIPVKTTPASQPPAKPTPSRPPSKVPPIGKHIKTEPKTPVVKEKTIIEPTTETTTTLPQLANLPILKWQSSETKVSPLRKSWALTKKVTLSPLAKPLQWLIHLSPEETRKQNLTLVYAASGVTSKTIDQTLKHLYQKKPNSPEVPFWQNLKATFKTQKPPFSALWENYYEWDRLGKVKSKVSVLKDSRLVKIVSFGRFKNLSGLKSAFWRRFKKSKLGGFISRRTGKIIKVLPKLGKFLGKLTPVITAWETFKKAGKVALGAIGAIFLWAAHYGPAAIAGAMAGLGVGIFAGIKVGLTTFGALVPFIGPFAAIPAVITGLITVVISTGIGALIGVGVQVLLDKLGAAMSSSSLPQAGAAGFAQSATVAVSGASMSVPIAIAATATGVLVVSQITSSAFILPWEGGKEYGSRFIQIEKTASYPKAPNRNLDNSDLPFTINYQITITAKESGLDNIRIFDSISLYQESGKREIKHQDWTIDHLDQGESWSSPEYNLEATTDFEDALLSNHAVVKAIAASSGEEENSQVLITLAIGTPPIPPNAFLALQIVNVLNSCRGLVPEAFGVRVDQDSWNIAKDCLVDEGYNQAYIIGTFETSIDTWDNLQCVAFAKAASQGTLPSPGESGSADGYCASDTLGYTYSEDWNDLRAGDYVVSEEGAFGHIAVVTEPPELPDGFAWLAEAVGDSGAVQRRSIGLPSLRKNYCGYLRRN
jgi:F0F1-type ATP synthase membrane subunit b/b'